MDNDMRDLRDPIIYHPPKKLMTQEELLRQIRDLLVAMVNQNSLPSEPYYEIDEDDKLSMITPKGLLEKSNG